MCLYIPKSGYISISSVQNQLKSQNWNETTYISVTPCFLFKSFFWWWPTRLFVKQKWMAYPGSSLKEATNFTENRPPADSLVLWVPAPGPTELFFSFNWWFFVDIRTISCLVEWCCSPIKRDSFNTEGTNRIPHCQSTIHWFMTCWQTGLRHWLVLWKCPTSFYMEYISGDPLYQERHRRAWWSHITVGLQ